MAGGAPYLLPIFIVHGTNGFQATPRHRGGANLGRGKSLVPRLLAGSSERHSEWLAEAAGPLSVFLYAFSTTYRRMQRSCNRPDSNYSSDFVRWGSQPSLIPVVYPAVAFLCSSPFDFIPILLCRNRTITLEFRLSRAAKKMVLIRSGRNCPPFGWHEFLDERTNLRDGKLSSVNHLRRRLSKPNRYLSGIDFILEQVDAHNGEIVLRNGIQL